MRHVRGLLADPRLVVDTSLGRRPAASLRQVAQSSDASIDLKRLMATERPDRAFEERMPVGQTLETQFAVTSWMIFHKIVGTVRVAVVPPTQALLRNQPPRPMSLSQTKRALAQLPPPLRGVPATVVLVSTSGFDVEAHELADRTAERVIVLAEPNAAGGWSIHGPAEMRGTLDLLDPEPEGEKLSRIARAVEASRASLSDGSLSADKVSLATHLPLQLVEHALKRYAQEIPGLVAKRIDGRVLLFREGTSVAGRSIGGEGMSLLDRIKTLFNRKGDHDKKIAFLSERRAALAQQRDHAQEEVEQIERRESDIKRQFKETDSLSTRKRLTTQLVQLRKDIDRRQQMLGVLSQQVNVVSTHLHNLELVQQGRSAQLPDSEEIAGDAAQAEEMLANLQADAELADSVSAAGVTSGMSGEEQAMYEELTSELGAISEVNTPGARGAAGTANAPERAGGDAASSEPASAGYQPPRRTEPEAG